MKKLLILLMTIIYSIFSHGQEFKFKTYTVEDGLSNNSINKIINAENGGLWIATWDGLNYFDGHQFRIYKHVTKDSSSLAGNYIQDLALDAEGNLWVQSQPKVVSMLTESHQFLHFELATEFSLSLDQQGHLYLLGEDGCVHVWRNGDFEKSENFPIHQTIESGLMSKTLSQFFPDLEIKDAFKDKEGNIWFATLKKGLYILPKDASSLDRTSLLNFTVDSSDPYGLRSNELYTIHEDVFGNIWLGTKDGGLSMALERSQSIGTIAPYLSSHPELPSETIRAIHEDDHGAIWLGYYNAGIFIQNRYTGLFEPLLISPPTSKQDWKRIRSIFRDSKGSMWIGTYAGLMRVGPGGEIFYFNPGEKPFYNHGRHYAILEDENEGVLWVSSWGGLAKYSFDQNEFISFEGQEQLEGFHFRGMALSGNGLWLATESNGLLCFKEGHLSVLDYSKGLLDNSVYGVYHDPPSGNLWVGTLGGISIFHPEEGFIHHITEKEGLLSQLVYGMAGGERQVWVSTTKGIAAIDRWNFQVTPFPPEEGWQAGEFSEGAVYKNDRGIMFFAGVKGLNFFNPDRLNSSFDLPMFSLEKVFNNSGKSGKNHASTLQVKVEAIEFTKNPQNRIEYKLEPGDKEWKAWQPGSLIHYDALLPGSYVLKVKNSQDHQEAKVALLHHQVPMPLYKSPYFLLLVSAGLLLGLFHWRIQHNKALRKKLERLIVERTRIIEQQKNALLSQNKTLDKKHKEIQLQKAKLLTLHQQLKNPDLELEKFKRFVMDQFQPPLQRIKRYLEKGEFHVEEDLEQSLGMIDRLTRELRDWERLSLLDHLKDVKPTVGVLSMLLENLTGELGGQLKKRGIHLYYDFRLSDEWVVLDVLRFKFFYHCFFRELIKFIESEAELTIEGSSEKDELFLRIQSNSDILSAHFVQILTASPTLKSARKLLDELKGTINYKIGQSVDMIIRIPFMPMNSLQEIGVNPVWEQLEWQDKVQKDKPKVVVLGYSYEVQGLLDMIKVEDCQLIQVQDPKLLVSAMRKGHVDVLLIYNVKPSAALIALMNQVKKGNESGVRIPVLYVYEWMEYGFQEKLMDLGIDSFIQLPCENSLIQKNVEGMLQLRKSSIGGNRVDGLLPETDQTSQVLTSNERLIQTALRIIKREYANPNFKVENLSQELGVSKIKCYRLFKETVDSSPSDIILKLRLQKAEKLLLQKNKNISEVGFACGFNDPKYFSKIFKKHYGASPKAYSLESAEK